MGNKISVVMSAVHKCKSELNRCLLVGKNFGITLGIESFFNKFVFRNEITYARFKQHYYARIRNYLYNHYFDAVEYDYSNKRNNCIGRESIIWVMWWQGENKMPPLVRTAFESIKREAGKHKVRLITKDNYLEYVEIPSCIMEKVESGVISITHFSDIIRFALLYEYGGFWIDATVYMMHQFDDSVYKSQIYSLKHGKSQYLCNGAWSAFFWAGTKNEPLFKYVLDFFYTYWEHEKYMIDYFLIDCVIKIAYENIPDIRKKIDAIPENNGDIFEMEKQLNQPENIFEANGDTYIYKLSWKKPHIEQTKNGETTLFAQLVIPSEE